MTTFPPIYDIDYQIDTGKVKLQWERLSESRILASIRLGIEDARQNRGKMFSDTDLATDDDVDGE